MVYRARVDMDEGDVLKGTRVCRVCEERKPMTGFQWTSSRKHRVRICTDCQVSRARELRSDSREHVRQRSFVANLRNTYGMTEDDYRSLLERQGGCCAICRDQFQARSPHVDHDHATGAVRGILCFTCNTAIGKMRDDPALLRAAAEYLERQPPEIVGRSRRLSASEVRQARSANALKQHASPEGQRHLRNRPRGEAAPGAVLTDAQVAEIVLRYRAGGVSQRSLAMEFGCSQGLVSNIVRGKTRRLDSAEAVA